MNQLKKVDITVVSRGLFMADSVTITDDQLIIVKRTATSVYNRYLNRYTSSTQESFITAEELYHQGVIGLLKARNNFKASTGIPFMAFALFKIKGEMISFIREKSAPIRIPQKKYQEIKKLKAAQDVFDNSADAGEYLGWSREKLAKVEKLKPKIIALDPGEPKNESPRPAPVLKSEGQNPEKLLEKKNILEIVSFCIERITRAEERHILISRYEKDKTLKELSLSYNCSVQTIKNKQIRAEESVERCLKQNGLE